MQDPTTPMAATEAAVAQPTPAWRKSARRGLLRLVAAALTLPVAIVLTIVVHPLWSWLERSTGIESMGREGPAAWCYLTVWGLLALARVVPALWRAARGAGSHPTSDA